MLAQTRPPSQLIVVDSSDAFEPVSAAVALAVGSNSITSVIEKSPKGLTLQRNRGLRHVECPITFFPDDDSIWFPDTAEQIVRVYERDRAQMISGVCARESAQPPLNFGERLSLAYRMRRRDRLMQRIGNLRTQFEERIAPNPSRLLGRSYFKKFVPSEWHRANEVVPVEWMTGFRMSFRTDVIRKVGFDENFSNYCLLEDMDASLAAWEYGPVVAAHRSRVYHYRSPELRGSGRLTGATQILNRAYVIAKHTSADSGVRRCLIVYLRYRIFLYLLSARGAFGRARLAGALAALRHVNELLSSTPEFLGETYRNCIAAVLGD
jgi:GT2 family glycosyltransferase